MGLQTTHAVKKFRMFPCNPTRVFVNNYDKKDDIKIKMTYPFEKCDDTRTRDRNIHYARVNCSTF